jgi:hypothetical protein
MHGQANTKSCCELCSSNDPIIPISITSPGEWEDSSCTNLTLSKSRSRFFSQNTTKDMQLFSILFSSQDALHVSGTIAAGSSISLTNT